MPRVSIAMPVYNGEEFVGEAVESLLVQTFTDFELVVVDNASTDRTQEICRSLAARDARVRYVRNDRNIGGGPNWIRAFELTGTSTYFKWAAHDDIHAPTFLELCVASLDRDPGAVLAFTRAAFVDRDGRPVAPRQLTLPLGSADVLERYEALLPSYDCLEVFGVIRRAALRRRPPIGLYMDADGVMLGGLALLGRFVEVPEVLFFNRRHAAQATTRFTRSHREWSLWWNPANAGRRVYPVWRRHLELWRTLLDAPLSFRDRVRCGRALARWTRWSRWKLLQDLTFYWKGVPPPTAGANGPDPGGTGNAAMADRERPGRGAPPA
jgi:glycosyltransferase involved in cell wall biosynthesis